MQPAGDDSRPGALLGPSSVCSQLMWCEQTQDMSGFTTDTAWSPSDELLRFTSTIQPENDIYVKNFGHPSPDEFIESDQDQFDTMLGEDSNMFDNSNNYRQLDHKIVNWLPNLADETSEINAFAQNLPLISEDGHLWPLLDKENTLILDEPDQTVKKPSGRLSVFDSEEPRITDTSDTSYSIDYKPFIIKDEMGVAEEVVVTTEEESPEESPDSSMDFQFQFDFKEEEVEVKTKELSPLETLEPLEWPLEPRVRSTPGLQLDIAAATSQLVCGSLPDTPDVLNPVLHPVEFDLINFLLGSGDANNNVLSLPSPLAEKGQGQGRRGLGGERKREWRKAVVTDPATAPAPGPSGRPTRKSAEKFRQLLEKGLLDTELASDEEEPKPKRRRSDSSSSRLRQNSESDLSSSCGDAVKYRERRDRNNLSSKLSRQKRKQSQKMKQQELKELEEKNRRLKKKKEDLARTVERVSAAWQQYLERLKRQTLTL